MLELFDVVEIDNPPAVYSYQNSTSNNMAEYRGDKMLKKVQGAFQVGFINWLNAQSGIPILKEIYLLLLSL